MRIALVGSRWFGAEMLKILHAKGHDIHVVAPDAEDSLATLAVELGYMPVLHTGRLSGKYGVGTWTAPAGGCAGRWQAEKRG